MIEDSLLGCSFDGEVAGRSVMECTVVETIPRRVIIDI